MSTQAAGTDELTEYRARLRTWLDEHGSGAPERETLAPQDDEAVERLRRWQHELADAGYVGVTWPEEHGGPGGTPAQAVAVEQELEARNLAGPFDFVGIGMVGPTIMTHG